MFIWTGDVLEVFATCGCCSRFLSPETSTVNHWYPLVCDPHRLSHPVLDRFWCFKRCPRIPRIFPLQDRRIGPFVKPLYVIPITTCHQLHTSVVPTISNVVGVNVEAVSNMTCVLIPVRLARQGSILAAC